VSDYETVQKKRNITVGIFVVVALCALAGLIYKFGDLPWIYTKYSSFQVYVQFPTASGVQRDTPVRFCGYQIGRVTQVRHPKVMRDLKTGIFYHQTLAVLSINKKYTDIPADVEVKLMTRGLGSSYIELALTRYDVNEPTGPFLTNESRLQGSTGVVSEFFSEDSQRRLDELVDGLKALIDNTNCVIGDPNNKDNLRQTLANLADASERAKGTIDELQQFAAAGTKTFNSIVSMSEELNKATAELRLILDKVNNGDGSAARIVNDGRLYESLLESTEQMQLLLQEMKSFVARARDKGVPIKLK